MKIRMALNIEHEIEAKTYAQFWCIQHECGDLISYEIKNNSFLYVYYKKDGQEKIAKINLLIVAWEYLSYYGQKKIKISVDN